MVERIHERLNAISSFRSQGVPTRKGDHMFFARREVGERYNTMFVHDLDGSNERPLADPEEFAREGLSVFVNSFSPGGRYLTYTVAPNQSAWGTVHVLRVADGELLPEALTGFFGGRSNIAWTVDGAGFFYSRYDVPDDPQAPLGIPRDLPSRPGDRSITGRARLSSSTESPDELQPAGVARRPLPRHRRLGERRHLRWALRPPLLQGFDLAP